MVYVIFVIIILIHNCGHGTPCPYKITAKIYVYPFVSDGVHDIPHIKPLFIGRMISATTIGCFRNVNGKHRWYRNVWRSFCFS